MRHNYECEICIHFVTSLDLHDSLAVWRHAGCTKNDNAVLATSAIVVTLIIANCVHVLSVYDVSLNL